MSTPPTKHDTLAPLRHPAFRYLFIGRFATFIGNAVAPIALAFAVLDLSDSGAVLGVVIACRMVPQILLTLFGGVIADRFSRIRVMVVSSSLGALSQGLAAALVLGGHAQIWQLAVIQAFNGAVSAFAFPASAGLTPQTVPGPILQQANALLRLVINAAVIGGAAVGGLLVASVGSGWALDARRGHVRGRSLGLRPHPPDAASTRTGLGRGPGPGRRAARSAERPPRAARRVAGVRQSYVALVGGRGLRLHQRGGDRLASACSARWWPTTPSGAPRGGSC